ncbi:MAG: penicillin-insensitive murein endopeptidase [Actinomycetota bacterium]
MRFEGRRLAGGLAVLSVATAVLAASVIAGAVDEERGTPGLDPSSTLPRPSTGKAESLDRHQQSRVDTEIRWRRSRALGEPWAGRLVRGVMLPSEGRLFFTWDPVRHVSPNRAYRRYATTSLIRTMLGVLRSHTTEHPDAPRVGIGDLSRPKGGDFGKRFGGLGHSSHQSGLDADLYYPRRDGREREPRRPAQIDRELAQDLVDRFVAAGAQYVFVGPHTRLTGPPHIVQPLAHHDDHMHVRIPKQMAGASD